jgi:hypothetical protein
MNTEYFYFPDDTLVPWPADTEMECCANCAYGLTEENECMNVYHPCEFTPKSK